MESHLGQFIGRCGGHLGVFARDGLLIELFGGLAQFGFLFDAFAQGADGKFERNVFEVELCRTTAQIEVTRGIGICPCVIGGHAGEGLGRIGGMASIDVVLGFL